MTPSGTTGGRGDGEAPGEAPTAPGEALDLGPTLRPIAFAPGRFAAVVQRTLAGTHAVQRLREHSSAAFILELGAAPGLDPGAGGLATACRGWRYAATNDGPKVRTADRFDDQHGYRGRFTVDGGVAVVELHADDGVCPRIRDSAMELRRSDRITLRCVLAAPHGHAALGVPVLLCQWVDVATDEARAHLVADLAPDGWMVLGPGAGLRIAVTGQPPGAHVGEPTRVEVTAAPSPIDADAWRGRF